MRRFAPGAHAWLEAQAASSYTFKRVKLLVLGSRGSSDDEDDFLGGPSRVVADTLTLENGTLDATIVRVTGYVQALGMSKIPGFIAAQSMLVRTRQRGLFNQQVLLGSVKVERQFEVQGNCTVVYGVAADVVRVDGDLKVGGDIHCQSSVAVQGLLLAQDIAAKDNIDISLRAHTSTAVNLHAHTVKITRGATNKNTDSWLSSMWGWAPGSMELEEISAERVTVDNCSCLTIKTKDAYIGANSSILTLEYDGELEVHDTAKIVHLVDRGVMARLKKP